MTNAKANTCGSISVPSTAPSLPAPTPADKQHTHVLLAYNHSQTTLTHPLSMLCFMHHWMGGERTHSHHQHGTTACIQHTLHQTTCNRGLDGAQPPPLLKHTILVSALILMHTTESERHFCFHTCETGILGTELNSSNPNRHTHHCNLLPTSKTGGLMNLQLSPCRDCIGLALNQDSNMRGFITTS